jgi:hypothetical protein
MENIMTFWQKFGYFARGFWFGLLTTCCLFMWVRWGEQVDHMKERLPEVREYDAQQLPPGAKNLRGLGNRWIEFEMDVEGHPKTFIFRRGFGSQADIMIQVK